MPSSKDPVINRQKAREWRLKNPDKHREANKLWQRKKAARLTLDERASYQRDWRRRNPVQYLLKHAKHRAAKAGYPFAISAADIEMPDVCPVFGWPFQFGDGKMGWRNMYAPSLDKIKPQLGYVPGNVMVISVRANHLKANATLNEMRAVLAYMERVGCNEDHVEQGSFECSNDSPQLDFGW